MAIEISMKQTFIIKLITALLLLTLYCTAQAQTIGETMCRSLLNNVVRIKSGDNNGFGFIIAQNSDNTYIVTAAHVINDTPESTDINVNLYDQQRQTIQAQLVARVPEQNIDIAFISIRTPSGLKWKADCLEATTIMRNDKVFYIGKGQAWEISNKSISATDRDRNYPWLINISESLLGGTSGAPLLSERGFAGVIIRDAQAITITKVTELAFNYGIPFQLTNCNITPITKETDLYNAVYNNRTISDCENYNRNSILKLYTDDVNKTLNELREKEDITDFQKAKNTNTIEAYNAYKTKHPYGNYVTQANQAIADETRKKEDLNDYNEARRINTAQAYDNYLTNHSTGNYVQQAKDAKCQIEKTDYDNATAQNTRQALVTFISKYKNGCYTRQAQQALDEWDKIPMALIPAGEFLMGSPNDEPYHERNTALGETQQFLYGKV